MRLLNKAILIAGAGPGIGRAVAALFASEGAKVVIASRSEGNLKSTVEGIRKSGGVAELVVGDLVKEGEAERIVDHVVNCYGRLDVLYNNISGGWVELGKKIHELSNDAYNLTVGNNLLAVYNLCKAGVTQLLKQGHGGCIINVSASRNARRQANPIYAYTKAGIIELTVHMANDYRQEGIRVNCILPGLISTEDFNWSDLGPVTRQLVRSEKPNSRQGHPMDIAYAALFLASDEASFITGECFCVDGGDDKKLRNVLIDLTN